MIDTERVKKKVKKCLKTDTFSPCVARTGIEPVIPP
jgi:hypothetical protein